MSISGIMKFTGSLLPTFKKDRLLEDARVVKTELVNYTIASYETSYELLASNKLASKDIKEYEKRYFVKMGGRNAKGMVADIYTRLQEILKVVNVIETAVEKNFETSIVVDGITLYKVSLIKGLETCGFISRYANRFLNYLYILESAAVKSDTSYTFKQLSKGEVKELETYFDDFCAALKALSKDHKNFQKELENTPNVTVGPNSEATLAGFSSLKLDPVNMFAVNGFVNPIYRIGMMIAEWQVARYKEAKELKTVLELRRLYLENMKNNSMEDEDGIQREIDVIQNRVDRCNEVIRKTEEKVGM